MATANVITYSGARTAVLSTAGLVTQKWIQVDGKSPNSQLGARRLAEIMARVNREVLGTEMTGYRFRHMPAGQLEVPAVHGGTTLIATYISVHFDPVDVLTAPDAIPAAGAGGHASSPGVLLFDFLLPLLRAVDGETLHRAHEHITAAIKKLEPRHLVMALGKGYAGLALVRMDEGRMVSLLSEIVNGLDAIRAAKPPL